MPVDKRQLIGELILQQSDVVALANGYNVTMFEDFIKSKLTILIDKVEDIPIECITPAVCKVVIQTLTIPKDIRESTNVVCNTSSDCKPVLYTKHELAQKVLGLGNSMPQMNNYISPHWVSVGHRVVVENIIYKYRQKGGDSVSVSLTQMKESILEHFLSYYVRLIESTPDNCSINSCSSKDLGGTTNVTEIVNFSDKIAKVRVVVNQNCIQITITEI